MTFTDFIIIAFLVIIVGGAIIYIIKKKKNGVKCIGCPDSGCCSAATYKNSSGNGSCTNCDGNCCKK